MQATDDYHHPPILKPFPKFFDYDPDDESWKDIRRQTWVT